MALQSTFQDSLDELQAAIQEHILVLENELQFEIPDEGNSRFKRYRTHPNAGLVDANNKGVFISRNYRDTEGDTPYTTNFMQDYHIQDGSIIRATQNLETKIGSAQRTSNSVTYLTETMEVSVPKGADDPVLEIRTQECRDGNVGIRSKAKYAWNSVPLEVRVDLGSSTDSQKISHQCGDLRFPASMRLDYKIRGDRLVFESPKYVQHQTDMKPQFDILGITKTIDPVSDSSPLSHWSQPEFGVGGVKLSAGMPIMGCPLDELDDMRALATRTEPGFGPGRERFLAA